MIAKEAIELSVVIPVYNEADNIEPLCRELAGVLETLGKSYEVLIVDDGSTDGTPRILRMMEEKWTGLRIFKLERHSGKSAALQQGFLRSQGPLIVTIDGDMQNDPRDIPRFLEAAVTRDAVIGWRYRRQDTLWKRTQSRIANASRRLFLRDNFNDINCPLRIFRREHISKIPCFEGVHRFYPVLLEAEGYTVGEIKINDRPRYKGESKYRMRDRVRKAWKDMWKVKRMIKKQNRER